MLKDSNGEDNMNKAFQALADPTRRTILKKLNKGEMTAGQIAVLF